MEFLSFFSVSCGTPSFAGRVDVELFNSTTVGSEIVYQCQSGHLPEGRMTSVCGVDRRWNPDPATLMCKGKTYVLITRQTKFLLVCMILCIGLTLKLPTSCSKLWNSKNYNIPYEVLTLGWRLYYKLYGT